MMTAKAFSSGVHLVLDALEVLGRLPFFFARVPPGPGWSGRGKRMSAYGWAGYSSFRWWFICSSSMASERRLMPSSMMSSSE